MRPRRSALAGLPDWQLLKGGARLFCAPFTDRERRLCGAGLSKDSEMARSNGWHFFMNPGPTNIPDRILRAMDRGTLDFTGAQFKAISEECFAGLQKIF